MSSPAREERPPGEPRDWRRIVDLAGGALISLVALLVAFYALLLGVFSHRVLDASCSQATGAVRCNGPLLTAGYALTTVGIAVTVVAVSWLQVRAYRRDTGLWGWPLLSIGMVVAMLLGGVILMRAAHPASVGALVTGTVLS